MLPPCSERATILDALEFVGFRSRLLNRCSDAVASFATGVPDLVVGSHHSSVEGPELLRFLQTSSDEEIPFVVLTDGVSAEQIIPWLRAGAADFLALPTTREIARARFLHFRQLRDAQREISQAGSRAAAADRARQQFLRDVTHELRSSLMAIVSSAEFLLSEGEISRAPRSRIDALRTLLDNANLAADRLRNLNDSVECDAGSLDIRVQPVAILPLIEAVRDAVAPFAEAKGIGLSIAFRGLIPEKIQTDGRRLSQILVELFQNAIKFTDEGRVHLDCRVLAEHQPPLWQFDLSDTGRGMTREQAALILQPFTETTARGFPEQSRTGMGLTTCNRLIKMLGGEIHVGSVPGHGTTLSFTIETGPLEGATLIGAKSADALLVPGAKNGPFEVPLLAAVHGRILIAEDAPDIHRMLSFVLKKAGAEVVVVENGQQAFDAAIQAAAEGSPFDLILMDMQMPLMDGYRATSLLRAQGYTNPIIALTASALPGDRDICLAAGCDDYFQKPIERAKFLQFVGRYCPPVALPDDFLKNLV
jgi:signal transduction histidine kinase